MMRNFLCRGFFFGHIFLGRSFLLATLRQAVAPKAVSLSMIAWPKRGSLRTIDRNIAWSGTHVGGSLAASNCTRIEARNSLNGRRKGQLRLESAGARRLHQPALALKSREQERACGGCKLSNEAYAPAGRCLHSQPKQATNAAELPQSDCSSRS